VVIDYLQSYIGYYIFCDVAIKDLGKLYVEDIDAYILSGKNSNGQ